MNSKVTVGKKNVPKNDFQLPKDVSDFELPNDTSDFELPEKLPAPEEPREDKLANLKASQDAEAALYADLTKPALLASEREALIQQINAQTAIRIAAYDDLAKAYTSRRETTALMRDAAAQQLEALKLVEQQLNRTKTTLADKRLEAIKMVEITAYSGQKYEAYASVLAAVAGVIILYIAAGWVAPRLANRGVPFTAWLPRLILGGGVLYLVARIYDLLVRRNDMFGEYVWPAAPRTLDALAGANAEKTLFDVRGIPSLCAGSYCCADGTEWVDEKGCVVSAAPPPKTKAEATLEGQLLKN